MALALFRSSIAIRPRSSPLAPATCSYNSLLDSASWAKTASELKSDPVRSLCSSAINASIGTGRSRAIGGGVGAEVGPCFFDHGNRNLAAHKRYQTHEAHLVAVAQAHGRVQVLRLAVRQKHEKALVAKGLERDVDLPVRVDGLELSFGRAVEQPFEIVRLNQPIESARALAVVPANFGPHAQRDEVSNGQALI